MAKKPPQSPSTATKPLNPFQTKIPKPPRTNESEVDEENIIPLTIDKLSPEQKKEFELMMKQTQQQFMNSFTQTKQGKVIQKYKLKLVADMPGVGSSKDGDTQVAKGSTYDSCDKGIDPKDGEVEGVVGDGSEEQLQFNNFQDRIDYAVQHALINQSGVLVNNLTNMVKSVVDGSIDEHQASGPVYLPGGVFPNYQNYQGDVMKEQFGLKPKDTGNLIRHPYPEWFERVPLPSGYKVPDFSKFSGQDNVSTYEHISRFLAQSGEASTIDALRVRLFPLSLSGSAFTWFSSLPYNSVNSWADLEKQFHSYFYSGIHEMKLSDLMAIRQRHDESMQDYIQRFREMRNRCYSLSLTDSQLADLAFQGLIAPIKEKFSSQDFESLSHLAQKVTLHEQRFAEAKKNFKKINHVYPYMYDSKEDDDSEVAATEWVRSKKVIPCQWVRKSRKEERFDFDITKAEKIFDLLLREKQIQLPAGHIIPSAEEHGKRKKYDKQQEEYYEEDDDGFDPHWGYELFRFCWNEGMRLPSIEDCPGCSEDTRSSSRSYNGGNRLGQKRNQKRRVQRLRNRERFQEVQQKINHRLKKTKTKQEWRVKSTVTTADEVEADKAKRLLKGKAIASASVNMVFTLPAEFEARQADVDDVEEISARLVLSPEQAIFEKPEGTGNRHLKPLYINGFVNGKPMSKMMVDRGAAVNLMPYATFRKLSRNPDDLIKNNMVLKDFGGNPSETKGVFNVEQTVDSKTVPTTFFVIDGKGSYSLLLGRDWINANYCIPSTMHQCLIQWQGDKIEIVPANSQLKMESPNYHFDGILEGSNVYTKDTVDDLEDKQGQSFMSADDLEEIDIGPGDRPRPTFISNNLSPEFRTKLIELLKEYRDCFASEYYEMPGLSRSIVEHRLPIKPGVRPYQQPPRRCKADMLDAVKAEVARLYDAGFICPCRYAEWVSNIVPVIKKNGKVRVCIDFRDLNKATQKDEYPMPIADQLADAASGHKLLSFMDEEDIHKTAFRCPVAIGLFEWVVMTFGLKSAGATYQRAMNYIFHDLIGWLVEVYIDDVVVKSKEIENHIADLRKVFERTRKYGLKMNPTKGIEVTQRSVNAIQKIQPPEDKKKLQELIGKLRHYLLSNECTVVCKADVVKYMLLAPILKGRVGKWIFALTEFDVRYESPKAIKGQAIADFIVDHRDDSIGSVDIVPWTLFFDGSVCTHGCGIGLVIISSRGASFNFAYTIKPYATNNQAEYEAVLKGLQLLKEVEADAIEIMGDSLLVISQLAGEYECKNDTLMVYNEKCRELMDGFRLVTLKHVSWEQNVEANDLAQGNQGSSQW
uniref:Polyprotein n=1 Tax=Oryza sativa subsp. japonica TaxID=39947 RepID=Q65WZ9_ORYSJ|nr:putative polyprotein [Oryza sativa Japonica Group]